MQLQSNLDPQSRRSLPNSLFAFAAYLVLSLIFFGRALSGHLSTYYVGQDTDPSLYIWSIAWWSYVIQHHVHPVFTKLIWAPYGINLAWITCLPMLGVLVAPLTKMLGPLATFNIVSLVALPMSAFAAYLLCTKFSKSFMAAVLGGLVFGFSPYMMAQLLSHMVLVLVFPIPLAVYFVVCRLDGTLNRLWFVTFLTMTLTMQFLLELEPFVLTLLIGGCAMFIALRTGPKETRAHVLRMVAEVGAAGTLTALLVSPYIYFFFAYGYTHHPLWAASTYSADLLNFIVPTPANAVGTNSVLQRISANFPGNIFEQGACIGIPLIAIALLWRGRHKGEVATRVLLGTLMVVCILSLGPFLHVGGRAVFPMPWMLLEKLPLLKNALPVRLIVFAFVPLAIVFTLWLSDPLTGSIEKVVGVMAMLALLMPNPAASFWASRAPLPEFFRDGTSNRLLSSSDIVLPLPFGQKGMCMLWQAESGMNFRMASGLTGLLPIEIARWPVVNVFFGSNDLPEPDLQLKAFIANLGITAIVVDAGDPHAAQWRQLLSSLAIVPAQVDGVLFYRIDPNMLKEYRGLTAIDMEERAERARFEILVAAIDKYLSRGGAVANLNVQTLESAGLFPAGWKFNPKPDAYRDLWSGQLDGGIGVGVIGSASALEPIIKDYGTHAAKVYFPYPKVWRSDHRGQGLLDALFGPQIVSSVSGESLQLMVMIFDPAHLHQASAHAATDAMLSLATAPRELSRLSPSH